MGFQIARISHDRLVFGAFTRRTHHDPGKAFIESLGGAILLRRITPSQTIAIGKDNAAQNTTVIDPSLPCDFGKQGARRTIPGRGNPKFKLDIALPPAF